MDEVPQAVQAPDAPKNNLVCFFLQGAAVSAQMMEVCVETIKATLKAGEVGVEFAAVYDAGFEGASAIPESVHSFVVDMPQHMRKIRIFDIIDLTKYETVLWIEPSSVVCSDLGRLFATCTPEKLYVYCEPGRDTMDKLQYGLQKYTVREKMYFSFNNIYGFNTLQAMFKPTDNLRAKFAKVVELATGYEGEHFTEQSFMNHVFLTQYSKTLDRTMIIRFFYYAKAYTKFDQDFPFIVSFPPYLPDVVEQQRVYFAECQAYKALAPPV